MPMIMEKKTKFELCLVCYFWKLLVLFCPESGQMAGAIGSAFPAFLNVELLIWLPSMSKIFQIGHLEFFTDGDDNQNSKKAEPEGMHLKWSRV